MHILFQAHQVQKTKQKQRQHFCVTTLSENGVLLMKSKAALLLTSHKQITCL